MSRRVRCPVCGCELYAERGGEPTLRAAVLKFANDGRGIVARCPGQGCREDLPVPWLHADEETPPPEAPRRRVVLRRRLTPPSDGG